MIDPRTLRIGNWVTYHSYDIDPEGNKIAEDEIEQVDIPTMVHIAEFPELYSPVLLTPDVFARCQIPDPWFHDFIHFYETDTERESKVSIAFKCMTADSDLWRHNVKIEYLHQLQNLYFTLAEDELIYHP